MALIESDPYGTDLALDPGTGDLIVWPNGDLGTVTDAENCVQALRGWVFTLEGELPLHPAYGSRFPQLVGTKGSARLLAEANSVLREILDEDRRFLSATPTRLVEVAPGTAAILVYLALAGGEQLQVSDLAAGRVDEVQAPEFADNASLDEVTVAEDLDFITQDEDELGDLADFTQTLDLLEPRTPTPED